MTLQPARFAVVGLALTAFVLLNCTQPGQAQTCSSQVKITLSIDGAGKCHQKADNETDPTDFVPLDANKGQCAMWVTASIRGFEVQFASGSSPFYVFTSPSSATTVTSPPAAGRIGKKYKYKSLKVNNQSCNNANQLGFIMR